MQQNITPSFYDCIVKDTQNDWITSFCRILLTFFILKLFNFVRYANNTTNDITLHNEFLENISCFEEQLLEIPNNYSCIQCKCEFITGYKLNPCILFFKLNILLCIELIMQCDVISCVICISYKVEYLEKEAS